MHGFVYEVLFRVFLCVCALCTHGESIALGLVSFWRVLVQAGLRVPLQIIAMVLAQADLRVPLKTNSDLKLSLQIQLLP